MEYLICRSNSPCFMPNYKRDRSLPYQGQAQSLPKSCLCSRTASTSAYTLSKGARIRTGGGRAKGGVVMCSTSPSQENVDMVTRISPADTAKAEDLAYTSQHPWDPHSPSFSRLLPEALRPYPSFEGWFLRIVDFDNLVSVGVIMATNYATAESQVTLLFALSDKHAAPASASNGNSSGLEAGRTYAVYARSKESKFTMFPPSHDSKENTPKGFEWEAPNLGHIVAKPHETFMDVTVEGYKLTSHMVHEVPWDADDSEKGPEGWARRVTFLPTHWYVYSLGSRATYELSSKEKGLHVKGHGLAHQEKNWGLTFPDGHVWMQAFSNDNKHQVVASGAYFRCGDKVKSPYIFAMGYRSPKVKIDMRANDPGVVFKDIEILPLERKVSLSAVGPAHIVKIKCAAPPDSFSTPLLCPIGKVSWQPACRESYGAVLELEVFEHSVWGVTENQKLIERQVFNSAGLEFGEDLMKAAED